MQPSPPFPVIAVPVVERPPDDPPGKFSVDIFTAYLITASLRHSASELHADFRVDAGRWYVRGWSREEMGSDEMVAVTGSKGMFRAVLAPIGKCYLTNQTYGGYGEVSISQLGRIHRSVIYMANDQWRGYWLRMFTVAPELAGWPGVTVDERASRT